MRDFFDPNRKNLKLYLDTLKRVGLTQSGQILLFGFHRSSKCWFSCADMSFWFQNFVREWLSKNPNLHLKCIKNMSFFSQKFPKNKIVQLLSIELTLFCKVSRVLRRRTTAWRQHFKALMFQAWHNFPKASSPETITKPLLSYCSIICDSLAATQERRKHSRPLQKSLLSSNKQSMLLQETMLLYEK